MKRLFLDMRPLTESAAYRRFWLGSACSSIGSQMTVLAITLEVHSSTNSSIAIGALGLVTALPAAGAAVLGGALLDRFDRRRVVLLLTSLQGILSVVLVVRAVCEWNCLWLLYVVASLQFTLAAVNVPAGQTFLPTLLSAELIPAGVALRVISVRSMPSTSRPSRSLSTEWRGCPHGLHAAW